MSFATEVKRRDDAEVQEEDRVNFKRKIVIIKVLDDLVQADLFNRKDILHENTGCRYILEVVICFSKIA